MITKQNSKAFTLIELLVVIAIIALLLAILMPSLAKVKEKGKSVVCRSSQKQLAYALIMYSDDHDGATFPQFMGGQYHLYVFSALPYIGGLEEVRSCPAAKIIYRTPDLGTWGSYGSAKTAWLWGWDNDLYPLPASPGPEDYRYGSYGFNAWLYSSKSSSDPAIDKKYFKKFTRVINYGGTPVFADSYWAGGMPSGSDILPDGFTLDNEHAPGVGDTVSGGGGMKRFIMNRHGDKSSNVAFADGHVDSVALEDFWLLRWNRDYKVVSEDQRPGIPR